METDSNRVNVTTARRTPVVTELTEIRIGQFALCVFDLAYTWADVKSKSHDPYMKSFTRTRPERPDGYDIVHRYDILTTRRASDARFGPTHVIGVFVRAAGLPVQRVRGTKTAITISKENSLGADRARK